jgi:hypothetical protein
MRDYGKVAPQFWTGETGKKLKAAGPEAVIVAMYLMTSPHANMIGLYYLPMIYLAHETGLGVEGASKGLQRAIEASFCAYDEASEHVFVYAMARFQIAEQLDGKDKRCKGVENELAKCPKGPLVQAFRAMYGASFHLPEASPIQAPSKPLGSQEQEQEQEQEEQKTLSASADAPSAEPKEGKGEKRTIPVKAILDAYHASLPMMPAVRVMTDSRKRKLKARWTEDADRQSVEYWQKFFGYVAKSDFLTGSDGRWTGCDFEWLIEASNHVKVIEGKYENRVQA